MKRAGHRHTRFKRFIKDIWVYTPFTKMVVLLIILWLTFFAGFFLAEQNIQETSIDSYGTALYWGVAAFSTAGIATAPISGAAKLIGGLLKETTDTLIEHMEQLKAKQTDKKSA